MRCALLHGFAGTPATWDDVVAAWTLPRAPRALALPGHGAGPVRDSWDANLEAVAAQLGSCDVAVGYSLGARVALGLVASGRIARAVLISVNPGISDDERPARRASDAAWTRMLQDDGVEVFERAWTAQPLFASQARASVATRAARRAARMSLDPRELARSLETMGLAAMPDYRGVFATAGERLALITGAEDGKYVAIAEGLTAASHEVIPASGHDPTLEQPEALALAIARAVVRLA